MTEEYGVTANVIETDRLLRKGAKVWLIGGWNGGGFERVEVRGASRSGRPIEKMVPIARLGNFRVGWLPEHLRGRVVHHIGSRSAMTEWAASLARLADAEREDHPNRREMQE